MPFKDSPEGQTHHVGDGCKPPHVIKSPQRKQVKKYKTYSERAEYLISIQPHLSSEYRAIANFFGPDEIPPIIKKKK